MEGRGRRGEAWERREKREDEGVDGSWRMEGRERWKWREGWKDGGGIKGWRGEGEIKGEGRVKHRKRGRRKGRIVQEPQYLKFPDSSIKLAVLLGAFREHFNCILKP